MSELLLSFVQWLRVNSDVLYELTQILFLGGLDAQDFNKSRVVSFSERVTCLSRIVLEIPIAAIVTHVPSPLPPNSDNEDSNLDDYDDCDFYEYHIFSMLCN